MSNYACLREALRAVVRCTGGAKAVACEMWPTRAHTDPEKAAQRLMNCLEEGRAERFSIEDILFLLARGARNECHAGMEFLGDALQYDVSPRADTAPRNETDCELARRLVDEQEALQRSLAGNRRHLKEVMDRLYEIDTRAARRAVTNQ